MLCQDKKQRQLSQVGYAEDEGENLNVREQM